MLPVSSPTSRPSGRSWDIRDTIAAGTFTEAEVGCAASPRGSIRPAALCPCQARFLVEVNKQLRSLFAVQLVEQGLWIGIVNLTPEPVQLIVPDAPAHCGYRPPNVPALSLSHTPQSP